GLRAALAALDHEPTRLAVLAERAVLARLEAGCAAPVGAHAVLDGATLTLSAVVIRLDGSRRLVKNGQTTLPTDGDEASLRGAREAAAVALGAQVADALLAAGAEELAPLRATGAGGMP
ncbi:MAG: hydroxymethylbilane synthase, partial [Micrococcales bacterium]|nr:hydroxymethylbilane synthase [Micrococcales bacterium]